MFLKKKERKREREGGETTIIGHQMLMGIPTVAEFQDMATVPEFQDLYPSPSLIIILLHAMQH